MTTYARAIHARKEEPSVQFVDLSEWNAPQLKQPVQRRCTSERYTPDLLDCDFIAFHRCLREYMMDKFGLLGDSEAFDLHSAIAPCIVLFDEADDTVNVDAPHKA